MKISLEETPTVTYHPAAEIAHPRTLSLVETQEHLAVPRFHHHHEQAEYSKKRNYGGQEYAEIKAQTRERIDEERYERHGAEENKGYCEKHAVHNRADENPVEQADDVYRRAAQH